MKSEDMRADSFNNGLNAGITVMKQLDEPQKPVVDSWRSGLKIIKMQWI